jgi:hypothetical protein
VYLQVQVHCASCGASAVDAPLAGQHGSGPS